MVVKNMKISKLLKEKYVKLDLEATEKKKALHEIVEFISSAGRIKDKKNIFSIIIKREKLGSTGIGNGVAIPHARSEKLDDFFLAFARQDKGVDFGALDGEKTYLFFMLVSPEEQVGVHLKLLAEISHLVKDKFIVDRLKAAKDKKEVLKIIETYER
ncbi:MAG TPA: PTS sugar transporter subunit IIA [Candidatus Omnitrophota bacterium]|nr:PTS sugar transporter subunit IIA [Candidatus Omnitrophota bacterium]